MTEYAPFPSWYSSETQRIVNAFPMWMKGRRLKDSILQTFWNPAGQHVERLVRQIDISFRDRFLELASLDEPDQVRRMFLPLHEPLTSPRNITNLVPNSSFEIVTSEDRLPDMWRSEGGGQAWVGTGILGAKGAVLQVASGQTIAIYQDITFPIQAGAEFCCYVWYQCQATGLTAPATGFGLEVVGYHGDGSTETLRASFDPDTGGYPRRAEVSGSFSQRITKRRIRIVVTNSGSFPITVPVTVDVVMMSEGAAIVGWLPNAFETYPYLMPPDDLAPIAKEHGHRAQYVEGFEEFWSYAIPTRVSGPTLISSSGTPDPTPTPDATGWTPYAESGAFVEVDFWDKEWNGVWQLGYQGANPRVRGYGVEAPDIYGPFDLAFRNWRNHYEDGVSWTPEAMTVLHNYLLVILKKQDHLGQTKRYAALVDPRLPRPFPTYMQVTAMKELPGISTSLRLSRAEIRYTDYQHLYVGDGQSEWVYQLHYDYFLIDRNENLMYVREDYGDVSPMLMAKSSFGKLGLLPREDPAIVAGP